MYDETPGTVYLNPFFGDFWVVADNKFIKLNDWTEIDLDEPEGFIKVGYIDERKVEWIH